MLNQLRYPPDHGYAPMDMPLPTVDMLRPGYAPMDMILLNCGYAFTKDWIFNFMGKNLNHNFKKKTPSKHFYFMSGSYSQKQRETEIKAVLLTDWWYMKKPK